MGLHGKHRPLVRAGAWALAGVVASVPGAAQAACRLALLLALDISSSVDMDEDALQRQGLASALRSPEVAEAALAIPGATVALSVFQWSGRYEQDLVLDWVLLEAPSDLAAAADTIAASQRSHAEFPTALGYAVGHSATIFGRAPDCLFRTLDVSGDGVNNAGFPPRLAYRHFPLDDVTVNGLAIGGHDPDVFEYYRAELIRGPGAFIEIATDFNDFERAMRRKLVREMGTRVVGALSRGGPAKVKLAPAQ